MLKSLIALWLFALTLSVPQLGNAQQEQKAAPADTPKTDPELVAMATKLMGELGKHGIHRVVIVDLRSPSQPAEQRQNAAGKWLADQIATGLRASTPATSVGRAVDASDATTDADAIVSGTFTRATAGRMEISLSVKLKDSSSEAMAPIVHEAAVPPDLPEQNSENLPDKIYRSGRAGVSDPTCLRCPYPEYSYEARRDKVNGTVVLDVLVTAEGTVQDAVVTRKLGSGLDEKAVKTVKGWKLKPCIKDGQAVTCWTNIQILFRIYP